MRNNLRRSRYGNGKNGRNKTTNKQKNGKSYYKKTKEVNPNRQQFESNGPLGKVRGNAQQIYDKYKNAGYEALSAGDEHKAELLFQYAEHYMVLLCDYREKYPEAKAIANIDDNISNDMESDISEESTPLDAEPDKTVSLENTTDSINLESDVA